MLERKWDILICKSIIIETYINGNATQNIRSRFYPLKRKKHPIYNETEHLNGSKYGHRFQYKNSANVLYYTFHSFFTILLIILRNVLNFIVT